MGTKNILNMGLENIIQDVFEDRIEDYAKKTECKKRKELKAANGTKKYLKQFMNILLSKVDKNYSQKFMRLF